MKAKDLYKTISIDILHQAAKNAGLDQLVDLEIFKKYLKKPTHQTKVLEIGCATGRMGRELIQCADYTGIDFNEGYLDYFRTKLTESGIDFNPNQIKNISFFELKEGGFDLILLPWAVIGDFESKQDQYSALKKAFDMLLPGGFILIDFLTEEDVIAGKGNSADGYNPTYFYHDQWLPEFHKIGFSKIEKLTYVTSNGKKRDMSILLK